MPMTERKLQLFEKKIMPVPFSGCWLWLAAVNKSDGYARFNGGDTNTRNAHAVSYEHFKGAVPKGYHVDHLCRVRSCVNPDHLEAVPARINLLRGIGWAAIHSQRTHCPKGHPYAGDNLVTELDRNYSRRRCRTCKNARQFSYNRWVRKGEARC